MLAVDVEKELGAFKLAVRFEAAGGVTALFGPSGAGKTTVVNMIAGLLQPDRGSIVLGDKVLFDAAAGINVPPHRRHIGYVFQEDRLFPHLSVRQNLDYGRRMSGRPRDPDDFARIVALLDIGHLLERRPRLLSGGERQRVAVGRALLMRPGLLLLDEPLASLDAGRKREILPYLVRLRDDARVPMVYVSHTAAELRRIATKVVRLDAGRVVAAGGLELLDQARRRRAGLGDAAMRQQSADLVPSVQLVLCNSSASDYHPGIPASRDRFFRIGKTLWAAGSVREASVDALPYWRLHCWLWPQRGRPVPSPPAQTTPFASSSITVTGLPRPSPICPGPKAIPILDAMKAATTRPHGISFSYTGSGDSAVLTKIDDVQNQGGGAGKKNWQYWVNGTYGDRSFAVFELQAQDTIVWRFTTEQGK